MSLGRILTAIVTPFDADGNVDEAAFVALHQHVVRLGSDGIVACGTTGEASTLAVDEHLRVIGLAVSEKPPGTTVIAGTGSNDTRHAVEMTERATALGVDGILSVTPYYNKPPRRGLIAHYRAIAAATDRPIVLYNIPSRTALDMPNDLLAELAQIEGIEAVKQANPANLAPIDGLRIYAGNDDMLADVLDMGEPGGVLTASHLVGDRMRAMVDADPAERRRIEDGLRPLYEALGRHQAAIALKEALELLGIRAGRPRLPYVPLDDAERAELRGALERHGLLEPARS
ncbi:MAG TPA: 4-hydroxy-tetrahydrodipicolinate synthase [Solirubrobacteraceae bacterium]|jgi:4-hydroxy-tetrahydrodipicolinate synthase|nr:4-hydroxy-tetrahydrodipicolinate synthase [Solirubrobacteraceae bacterium]